MSVAKEFRDFVLRGNVVDLAVGVVIGAAFTAVVTAFTKDIITPIIGIPGKVSLGDVSFAVNGSKFLIGDFLNQAISFLLVALVVFFFVVKPVNWLMARRKTDTPADATTRDCPYCLSSIPVAATRCAFCTSEVAK
ncbi:large-conductance mechanosensitive channel [Capsulimonas corticalis]|uniref:Large-conductance mechanosensitive channel n=1 Tax=Capsulimonas corticalis TaxID=2219043 RepID=A0A402CUS8_9BACT|nr:large conductance mechanosensitive channel protein MscL [Capsulimonas corticalis]BDI29080.1 large-conductance mechanosensitive channel [Capsulimonas corticalis]